MAPSCLVTHPAETSVAAVSEASALLTYRVNALGPILVAKAFAPLLAATAARRGKGQQPTLVVNLSARLSSIKENKLGGWYSYRASKAALNMLTKSLAVEFAKEGTAVACLLLHPGTVATDLSRPFNRNGARGAKSERGQLVRSAQNVCLPRAACAARWWRALRERRSVYTVPSWSESLFC